MVFHDVVWDVFASIMKDAEFHVLHKQTYVFPPLALQFSHQWVNIVILVDGVQMLVNVIINDLIE
jgi:hypothetical protein